MVYVKYFIPDDGDDQAHPNVFKVSGCESVKELSLGDMKRSFPVLGKYHFRFLQKIGGTNMSVWMDAVDESELVPHDDDGQVFAKVSRIGVHGHSKLESSSSSSAAAAAAAAAASSSHAASSSSSSSAAASQRRESFGMPGGGAGRSTLQDSNGGGGGSRRNSERLISFEAESPSKSPFHADDLDAFGDAGAAQAGTAGAAAQAPGVGASSGGGATGTGAGAGGDEGLLDFGSSDGADFAADFSAVSMDATPPASNGSGGSSANDLFSLDAGGISQAPVSTNPVPVHSQMGGFTASNPMGGGQMMGAGLNGMQQPQPQGQGRGPMQNNVMGGMGLGALPHPSQLSANNSQNNLMSKAGKQDSFSDLGSFTMGGKR